MLLEGSVRFVVVVVVVVLWWICGGIRMIVTGVDIAVVVVESGIVGVDIAVVVVVASASSCDDDDVV